MYVCVCIHTHIYISEVGDITMSVSECKNKLIRYDTRNKVKTMTEDEQHDKYVRYRYRISN